ncbi:MAG: DUF692 domain-containing protein [Pseudomonadota bacterium]
MSQPAAAAAHEAQPTRCGSNPDPASGVGVGFKPQHAAAVIGDGAHAAPVRWFEVHAENYMGAGGPPHAMLTALRERYPLSIHGVGLSIGAERGLDSDHLARLKALCDRYEPALFSEHLAWSTHDAPEGGAVFLNDLLPLPYTDETLNRVARHIDQTQEAVGRRMLLENPATYVGFEETSWAEAAFLREITRRTGCGLLLDVNNVFVAAQNHGTDASAYLEAFPMAAVGEIHLAGHASDTDETGAPLLIDSHDRPVADAVWSLFAEALAAAPKETPVLVEWDEDVPAWEGLAAEAARAEAVMRKVRGEAAHAA